MINNEAAAEKDMQRTSNVGTHRHEEEPKHSPLSTFDFVWVIPNMPAPTHAGERLITVFVVWVLPYI